MCPAVACDVLVAHHFGQQLSGGGADLQGQGHAVEAAHRVLGADLRRDPRRAGIGLVRRDQGERQAVGIGQRQRRFVEHGFGLIVRHAEPGQALAPEIEAARGHRKAGERHLARTAAGGRQMLPGKERHRRAGRADLVAVVEMIDARVVEVDGALDEAQAQHLGVEVDVALRRAADRRDMVQPVDGRRHARVPCNIDPLAGRQSRTISAAWLQDASWANKAPMTGCDPIRERITRGR